MPRVFAIVFVAIQLCVSAHATLVAIVPARDGLVVAADSRFTFMGAPCDNAFKILQPSRPARTVALVTGDSIFVAPPPPGENPCRYLVTAPRLLDIGAVVTAYLDRAGNDPARISTPGLAAACVRAVERFQRSHPGALRDYPGKEIFSVVVASYDPVHRASTLRNFVVRIEPRAGRVQSARIAATVIGLRSPRGVWLYGESAYVNRTVYAGPGRRFLDPATLEFLRVRKPVAGVPMDRAAATAASVIRAASRTAQQIPPPSGIGGAIHLMGLGGNPHPEPLPAPG